MILNNLKRIYKSFKSIVKKTLIKAGVLTGATINKGTRILLNTITILFLIFYMLMEIVILSTEQKGNVSYVVV